MNTSAEIWDSPVAYLMARQPDHPVHFFDPAALQTQAARFRDGFGGMVTFAVKANPALSVIRNLLQAGVRGFDVASPNEIRLVQSLAPDAALHYNNPVRSKSEIRFALSAGVRSFSVDSFGGLAKLRALCNPEGVEVSVRFKLPVTGAVYDFGAKFGAVPDKAVGLLQQAQRAGFTPSLTFHPGTQCEDAQAWASYIRAAADIARRANVAPARLNVGGGFPAPQAGEAPDLAAFFRVIDGALAGAFPDTPPALVCEPGRAMVAQAFAHAVRVKEIGDDGQIYLNDGIYGGLSEFPNLSVARHYQALSPEGTPRTGPCRPTTLFGPTCDSIDVLPEKLPLPDSLQEDDYILFRNMGAYVHGVTTDFNGYGDLETVTVLSL